MMPMWLSSLCTSENTRRVRAISLVVGVSFLTFGSLAEAAKVTKVKDKSVLIDNESTDIQVGEKYFAIVDGKKKAVILIKQVKGGKSLGVVTKGRAVVDASVEPTKSTNTASADNNVGADNSTDAANSDDLVLKKKKKKKSISGLYIGGLIGYAMDSQTLPDTSNNSVAMKGSGYSLKAFGDLPIVSGVGAIARLGIENFNVSGTSPAMGGVSTSIMYLSADILARYQFTKTTFVPFVAGGVGIHYPLSKSSNILNVPQISTTTVFLFEGGFNYNLSPKMYLVLLGDYGLFPPSNNVSTNLISARAGMGFHF